MANRLRSVNKSESILLLVRSQGRALIALQEAFLRAIEEPSVLDELQVLRLRSKDLAHVRLLAGLLCFCRGCVRLLAFGWNAGRERYGRAV